MAEVKGYVLYSFGFLLAASLAAGCGAEGQGKKQTLPREIPSSFDPCRDIPLEIKAEQQFLDNPEVWPEHENGEVKLRGCEYRRSFEVAKERGLGVMIEVTNMNARYFLDVDSIDPTGRHHGHSIKIGNREAAVRRDSTTLCDLVVDIKGGGIEFIGSNNKDDPCEDLENLAERLVPVLPPSQ
ncbi:DUF3558 family protein [Nocardia sp. NPDC003482]